MCFQGYCLFYHLDFCLDSVIYELTLKTTCMYVVGRITISQVMFPTVEPVHDSLTGHHILPYTKADLITLHIVFSFLFFFKDLTGAVPGQVARSDRAV